MDDKNLISKMLGWASDAGATHSEVLLSHRTHHQACVRLDEIESLEYSENHQLALRVWVGKSKALLSSQILDATALADLCDRAVAIAQKTPEDEASRLASTKEYAATIMPLDLHDDTTPQEKDLIARARELEQAARAHKDITNSEGSACGFERQRLTLATSEGFHGHYDKTDHSIALSVIAGSDDNMERDYEFKHVTHWANMGDLESLGRETAQRTVNRLNAQKIASEAMPVIFAPRVASSLLRHLIDALSGERLVRQTSFLCSRFEEKIMDASITIIDDPHRARGHRSRPFDSEGLAGARTTIVGDGILKGRFLDIRNGHLLQLPSTAHAARKVSEHPAPNASNMYLAKGDCSPQQLMADIARGFYVTELLGSSLNLENGDYSRGASGFLIENGDWSHAVGEVTLAGNLRDVFASMRAADDLEFKSGIDAPSLRTDCLMVAGK